MATVFSQLRVLVVAADPAAQLPPCDLLRGLGVGHVVALAADAAGLALLDSALRCNLVLCDLGTPYRAANDFIWHVRIGDPDIPIIALKGDGSIGDRGAQLSGADVVLGKPLSRPALDAALHGLLVAKREYFARPPGAAGQAFTLPRDLHAGPADAAADAADDPVQLRAQLLRVRLENARLRALPAALPLPMPLPAAADLRFTAIKRRFAAFYHPDSKAGSGLAPALRSAVFKDFWAEFGRIEQAGRAAGPGRGTG